MNNLKDVLKDDNSFLDFLKQKAKEVASNGSSHPDTDSLNGYVDGSLDTKDSERVREHIRICPNCAREVVTISNIQKELEKRIENWADEDPLPKYLKPDYQCGRKILMWSALPEYREELVVLSNIQEFYERKCYLIDQSITLNPSRNLRLNGLVKSCDILLLFANDRNDTMKRWLSWFMRTAPNISGKRILFYTQGNEQIRDFFPRPIRLLRVIRLRRMKMGDKLMSFAINDIEEAIKDLEHEIYEDGFDIDEDKENECLAEFSLRLANSSSQ